MEGTAMVKLLLQMLVAENNGLPYQDPIYAVLAVSVNIQDEVQEDKVYMPEWDFIFNVGGYFTAHETKLDLNLHCVRCHGHRAASHL